jgi:hypothetical protein
MAITQAGYIVTDDTAIWGTGATSEAAWDDMVENMRRAGTEVIYEPACDMDGKTLASGFNIEPATAALIAQVEVRGGAIGWGHNGGIACTSDEEPGRTMSVVEQERALTEARTLAAGDTTLRLDRCRHVNCDTASIWIFAGETQIGSISRFGRWKTNRMIPVFGPISERYYDTLAEAVADILAHAAELRKGGR